VTSVHVTETYDDDELHVITHIETTPADVTDSELSSPIHDTLARKALLPNEHFLDSGYVDADLIVKSQRNCHLSVKIGCFSENLPRCQARLEDELSLITWRDIATKDILIRPSF